MHLQINGTGPVGSCAEDRIRTGSCWKQRDTTQISREGMILTLLQADPTNPGTTGLVVLSLSPDCVMNVSGSQDC